MKYHHNNMITLSHDEDDKMYVARGEIQAGIRPGKVIMYVRRRALMIA
jgi:hypothetical protein